MSSIEVKVLESETRRPEILTAQGPGILHQWAKILSMINEKYLNCEIEVYYNEEDGLVHIEKKE